MSLTMNIDLQRSARLRCFAVVVTTRPGAGQMWRVYMKRASMGQEGSN
jgi:hypothetical protein